MLEYNCRIIIIKLSDTKERRFSSMKDKKNYVEAELEVIKLGEDIITASGGQGGSWGSDGNIDSEGWT
jgi:hypothetical protein